MALAPRAVGTLLLTGAMFLAMTALAVSARPGDPGLAEQTIVVSPHEDAAVAESGAPVTNAGEAMLPLPVEYPVVSNGLPPAMDPDPVPLLIPVIEVSGGVVASTDVDAQPHPPATVGEGIYPPRTDVEAGPTVEIGPGLLDPGPQAPLPSMLPGLTPVFEGI